MRSLSEHAARRAASVQRSSAASVRTISDDPAARCACACCGMHLTEQWQVSEAAGLQPECHTNASLLSRTVTCKERCLLNPSTV